MTEIELVWVDLDPDAGELRSLASVLNDDERARVATRPTSALRRRTTVSLARRRLLAAEVLETTPRDVELLIATDGRRLAAGPRSGPVAISVSTCGDTGIVAVASSGAIGVDVEDFGLRASTPGFLARVATPTERAALEARLGAERERALLSLWTRKEAYLKATGEGIGSGLQRTEVPLGAAAWATPWHPTDTETWFLYDLDCPRGDLVAAAVAGPGDPAGERPPVLHVRAG